jgi:hypothetical protein
VAQLCTRALDFLSPLTTRRVTVVLFYPASTRRGSVKNVIVVFVTCAYSSYSSSVSFRVYESAFEFLGDFLFCFVSCKVDGLLRSPLPPRANKLNTQKMPFAYQVEGGR